MKNTELAYWRSIKKTLCIYLGCPLLLLVLFLIVPQQSDVWSEPVGLSLLHLLYEQVGNVILGPLL